MTDPIESLYGAAAPAHRAYDAAMARCLAAHGQWCRRCEPRATRALAKAVRALPEYAPAAAAVEAAS